MNTNLNANNWVQYVTKSGRTLIFDQSKVLEPFGIPCKARVNTPKGPATVIGVYNDNLWFHIDGDKGATYWDNVKCFATFTQLGFTLIPSEKNEADYFFKEIQGNSPVNFASLWNQNIITPDITLKFGKSAQEFGAHKIILFSCSKFFQKLFASKMKDSLQNMIQLPDISEEIGERVLEFMYCNRTKACDILELYAAASFLVIETLQNDIIAILKTTASPSNILVITDFARTYQLPLLNDCEQFIENICNGILDNPQFLEEMSLETIQFIGTSSNLKNVGKHRQLKAVLEWNKIHCDSPQCLAWKSSCYDEVDLSVWNSFLATDLISKETHQEILLKFQLSMVKQQNTDKQD